MVRAPSAPFPRSTHPLLSPPPYTNVHQRTPPFSCSDIVRPYTSAITPAAHFPLALGRPSSDHTFTSVSARSRTIPAYVGALWGRPRRPTCPGPGRVGPLGGVAGRRNTRSAHYAVKLVARRPSSGLDPPEDVPVNLLQRSVTTACVIAGVQTRP